MNTNTKVKAWILVIGVFLSVLLGAAKMTDKEPPPPEEPRIEILHRKLVNGVPQTIYCVDSEKVFVSDRSGAVHIGKCQ